MGHYIEIPIPFPVLFLFFSLLGPKTKSIFKNRFYDPVPYLFLLLLLPGREMIEDWSGDCGSLY